MDIHIAAAALLREDGRTLLVRKRGTTVFMQPGGKIDPGETPLEALCREIFEELAIEIAPEQAEYIGRLEAAAAHERNSVVHAEMFRVTLTGAAPDEIRPQAEIEDIRWIGRSDVQDVPLAPLTRDQVLPAIWG